jgi:hypothetical protein
MKQKFTLNPILITPFLVLTDNMGVVKWKNIWPDNIHYFENYSENTLVIVPFRHIGMLTQPCIFVLV